MQATYHNRHPLMRKGQSWCAPPGYAQRLWALDLPVGYAERMRSLHRSPAARIPLSEHVIGVDVLGGTVRKQRDLLSSHRILRKGQELDDIDVRGSGGSAGPPVGDYHSEPRVAVTCAREWRLIIREPRGPHSSQTTLRAGSSVAWGQGLEGYEASSVDSGIHNTKDSDSSEDWREGRPVCCAGRCSCEAPTS